jgi:hypothetical protein
MPQTSSRVSPRAASRIRPRLAWYALAAASAGALLAAGSAGAVGLPRPGLTGFGDRLTVTYDDGGGRTATRTLNCGIATAADTGERDACARLDELGGPLAPVPAGQMCTMIYGGPQTARVTGVWHGEVVDESYRRTDGCEVSRWNRMVPALPSPAGAADGGRRMLAT